MQDVYESRNIKCVAHCIENRVENGESRTKSYSVEYVKDYGTICRSLCTTNGNFEFFVIDGKAFDNACEEIKEALFLHAKGPGKNQLRKMQIQQTW